MNSPMKKSPFVFLATFALAFGMALSTRAALVAYEGFNYADGSDLGGQNGGTGWSIAWETSGQNTVSNTSLSYTDGALTLTTTGGKLLNTAFPTSANAQPGRNLSAIRGADDTTTWLAFLGQRIGDKSGTAGPGGSATYERGCNIALFATNAAANNERLDIGESSGVTNDAWMLRATAQGGGVSNSISTSPIDVASFIVVRIDHKAGTNDQAWMWVNPALSGEPSTNSSSARVLGAKEFSFDRLRLFAGFTSGQAAGQWYVDEIRVGDTFTDVAPTGLGNGHYRDATNETGLATTFDHLDITGMEITNNATDIFFTLSVRATNINTPDWGKYLIAIDSVPGGATNGNGWNRPINMSSGMDYWIGSWVDAATGSQLFKYNGTAWVQQSQTTPTIASNSITFQTSLASLGLSPGNTFKFDAYTSGGNTPDGAVDALANPNQSISDWGVVYDSGTNVYSYTVTGTAVAAPRFTSVQVGGAQSISLTLTGAPATLYTIYGSTNVNAPFTNVVGTALTDLNGVGNFTDPGTLSLNSRRFYRASSP